MSITKDYIRGLLGDLENDSVERTISTTNTDKFGQAICAFEEYSRYTDGWEYPTATFDDRAKAYISGRGHCRSGGLPYQNAACKI